MKFVIAARLDARRSLLGRIVSTRAADARQAEAYLILTVALLTLAAMLGGYLGWALVPPGLQSVFAGVMAGFVVLIGLSLVGRRPAIMIRADAAGLLIGTSGGEVQTKSKRDDDARVGSDLAGARVESTLADARLGSDLGGGVPGMEPAGCAMRIPYSHIERFERIDDLIFHRHYRRYAETRVFVNRIPSELLLIRAGGVPIVIGLETEADRAALETLLAEAASVLRASSWVDVA